LSQQKNYLLKSSLACSTDRVNQANSKLRRVAVRIALGLAAFVIFVALACLNTVDYTPYFRTPYYKATKERFKAVAATNATVRGEFQAGFGRAKLTPQLKLPLAGYGERHGKLATGAHDDLFVKAAALKVGDRVGIMFGVDALIVPREVSDAAAERLSGEFHLAREQLYFSATHTHCGIGGWGEGVVGEMFAGKFDPAARAWFVDCVTQAARQAIGDLKPAEFGHGSFTAREYIRNRLIGDLGKIDPEFSYVVIKQNGKTNVLGSYSAHATVQSGRVMEFSADYPGCWQRAVEEVTGGAAIFFAGGVGSQGPVAPSGNFEGADKIGRALAQKLLAELPKTKLTNSIAFEIFGLTVAMPSLNTRLTDSIRLRPWVTRKLLPSSAGDSFVQGFRLNDSVWLSTPCDYSGELALGIKDHLRARNFSGVVTSFNGDYVGYVIPGRYYHMNGYEPRVMSFYGPYVPDYLDELVRLVADELSRD
jgi:neutral ceramidase